jgi:hypothetical protein
MEAWARKVALVHVSRGIAPRYSDGRFTNVHDQHVRTAAIVADDIACV